MLAQENQRKRFRPVFDTIIDWMIANPGKKYEDGLTALVNRTATTISIIVNSDMFKARYEARRRDFAMAHDLPIIDKTSKIAEATLDAILETVQKKKSAIPLETLQAIGDSALARLGYGAKSSPAVAVNITQNNTTSTQNVFAPVSREDLLEARMALRQVQETKRLGGPPSPLVIEHSEAVPVSSDDPEEASLAPAPQST